MTMEVARDGYCARSSHVKALVIQVGNARDARCSQCAVGEIVVGYDDDAETKGRYGSGRTAM